MPQTGMFRTASACALLCALTLAPQARAQTQRARVAQHMRAASDALLFGAAQAGAAARLRPVGGAGGAGAITGFVAQQRFTDGGGQVFNVRANGAKGDLKTLSGCSMNAGSAALTCSGGLAASDVGKLIAVPGAGAGGADLSTTVLSFAAARLTLAAPAATNVSGKAVTVASNDTSAINATTSQACAAGGGTVYLPTGGYGVTGLTVPCGALAFDGAGARAARLANFSPTSDTLALPGRNYVTVRNLFFRPAVARTAGAEIRSTGGSRNLRVADVELENCYYCMDIGDASAVTPVVFVTNTMAGYYYTFIRLTRVYDFWIDGFSTGTNRLDGSGFVLDGGNAGGVISRGDVINDVAGTPTGYSLLVKNVNYTAESTRWAFFVGVYFDSHREAQVYDGLGLTFLYDWFSNRPGDGLSINPGHLATTKNITVSHSIAANCGGNGIAAYGGRGHVITYNQVHNNRSDGIILGSAGGLVLGNVADNGWGMPFNQKYGIHLYNGADHFIVKDNILEGNAAGGLLNEAGQGPTKIVGDNLQ